MSFHSELLKGTTGLLLLCVIAEEDLYGYQITQIIKSRTSDRITLNEGSLYPILHAYEKKGYLSSYTVATDGNRKRKYYRLTPLGKTFLAAHLAEWQSFTDAVGQVLKRELAHE